MNIFLELNIIDYSIILRLILVTTNEFAISLNKTVPITIYQIISKINLFGYGGRGRIMA